MPTVGIGRRGILSCKLVEIFAFSSTSGINRKVAPHFNGVESYDEAHHIATPGVSVGRYGKNVHTYLSIWKESATRASEPTA